MLYVFLAMLVVPVVNGQECLRTNNANGLPQFRDYGETNFGTGIIYNQHQAIITSYRFDCCGNITEWAVDVHPGEGEMYTLDLQVWRPSPTVETNGCYSLAGNNRFTSVRIIDSVAEITPLPQDRIEFQPGDVIGFCVENNRAAPHRGVAVVYDLTMRGDGRYRTEEVWHADISSVTSSDQDCPYPVGSAIPGSVRVLTAFTNAAPVISVAFSATVCPWILPTSSITTSPTSFSTSSFIFSRTTSRYYYSTPPVHDTTGPHSTHCIIIGLSVVGILVFIIITLLVLAAVCLWMNRNHNKDFQLAQSEAYGAGPQSMATDMECDTTFYDYPTRGQEAIALEKNAAYDTNVNITPNLSYVTNISMEKNIAYEAQIQRFS